MIAEYLADHVLAEASTEVNPRGAQFTVRDLLDRVGSRIGGDFQGHPEMEASVRETVGKSYLSLGEYARAEPHLRASLALDVELRGAGDPSSLRVSNLLAMLLEQSGRPAQARELLVDNLATSRRSLGPDDPITLDASARLGALLRAGGKLDEAEPLIRSALEARRRVLPTDHSDTLRCVRDLCLLELDRRHFDAAGALADEYERGIRCSRGPKHPDNVTALANLGLIQLLRGRPDLAEPFYRRAADEARRILGEGHAITLAAIADHARVDREAALAKSTSPPDPPEKSP
jgi:eukaryotic-like serine/threonine-protein kinase